MQLVSTQKFGINIVFSWDDCNTHEKLETMVMKNLRVDKVHYGLCENGDLRNT